MISVKDQVHRQVQDQAYNQVIEQAHQQVEDQVFFQLLRPVRDQAELRVWQLVWRAWEEATWNL